MAHLADQFSLTHMRRLVGSIPYVVTVLKAGLMSMRLGHKIQSRSSAPT